MLHSVADPAQRSSPQARLLAVVVAWLLYLGLALGLAGCDGRSQPPTAVVQSALKLQIELTQADISEALQVKPPGSPEVSRVRVEQRQGLAIGAGRGVRVEGQFDWRLPGDPVRVDSPFEIYLQRGERGQSWRLARPRGDQDPLTPETDSPNKGNQQWITDPLPV
ncbi:hypothetical protein [Cyanobium sp. WAJ14-Wanaka]|uniref:hypothetical protein n=1 Tax=Cyanobium sp. WAJ14-Wanaka TaxID=2823725 RepID=UPI0020CE578C|nr:hypothetical protein [Cyanobium sp. WAJ14-Wanaka]MCP9774645.1 hypothetical protein [Cyanobium sp. WAJ14-Wanaka]